MKLWLLVLYIRWELYLNWSSFRFYINDLCTIAVYSELHMITLCMCTCDNTVCICSQDPDIACKDIGMCQAKQELKNLAKVRLTALQSLVDSLWLWIPNKMYQNRSENLCKKKLMNVCQSQCLFVVNDYYKYASPVTNQKGVVLITLLSNIFITSIYPAACN